MANRIKGIIVEIGGDTSNLSAALKGLDSDISKTQSQLRDVNKLLKLDPHNTELLAQKHKLLAQAVDDTSKRLKELKDARKAAESNLKNYDDWKNAVKPVQDEIDKTSSKLNNLKKQRDEMEKAGDVNSDAYKTLQTQIDETSNRLDELKKRQKEINEQFGHPISPEQYDSLKREIIDTENKLKDLESQARKSFDAIAAIGDAGKALKDVGDKITGIGTALAPLSGAAAAGLGAATKTFADFDAQLSKVEAIANADEQAMQALREEAIRLGGDTKFSASEVAQAYEYMAMAGWKSEKMLSGVPGVVYLAAASGEDLARTSDIITDAMTALQIEVDDAGANVQHFADILAVASANSNTNVDMLGESFKYVTPLAGQLKYSAEDLALGLGLMANNGIKAGTAGKQLRNLFTNMAKPTDGVATAMKALGLSLEDGNGNLRSMREVMLNLREGFGGVKVDVEAYAKALEELDEKLAEGSITQKNYDKELKALNERQFGSEGALKARYAAMLAGKQNLTGLLAIVGSSDKDFNDLAEALDHASDSVDGYNGAAERMAAIMQDNLEGDITSLKSKIETLAISIGEILNPILRDIVQKLQDFMNWLNSQDETTKKIITTVGLIVAAAAPLLIVIGNVVSSVGGLLAALPAVSAAFGGWVVPVGLAVAAIAALTGAISDGLGVSLEDMAAMAKDVMGRIVDGILTGLPRLADAAVQTMREFAIYLRYNLPSLIKSGLEIALKLVQSIRENAGKLVDGALYLAKSLAQGLAKSIPVIIQNVPAIVSSIAGVINDNAPKILMAGIEIIWTLVKGILDSIPVIIENIPQIIKAIVDVITAFNWLNLGANIITWMKNGINTLKTAIPDALHSIGDTAKNLFKNIEWGELGSSVVNAIKSGITSLFKAIPDTLASIANAAKEAFTSIDWKQIGIDLLQGIWNGITSIASGLLGYVGNFVSDIMDRFTGKEGFDENSPSKWAKKVGSYVPVGLAEGFAESTRLAENAASKTVKAVESSFDFSRLSALSQIAVASTSPVKAALSAPLPSAYPNTAAYQNAVRGQYSPVSSVPAQTLRQTPIEISVNNIIGGERVARLQYRYTADEANRRGPSLVKV